MTELPAPTLYRAFISYSHAADGKLAPTLQAALQSFAKPWYRLRSIRVFRDKTEFFRQSCALAGHRKSAARFRMVSTHGVPRLSPVPLGRAGNTLVARPSRLGQNADRAQRWRPALG